MSEERINNQRQYWLEKIDNQVRELCMLSLDGNKKEHAKLLNDLGTSIVVLWRFDRKLNETRARKVNV